MAFTSTDLANIEAAIAAFATGSQIVAVTLNGKRIEYAKNDLTKLQELRSIIQTEIGTVQPRAYAKQGGRAST